MQILEQDWKTNPSYRKMIMLLLEKGFLYQSPYSENEEIALYELYYVKMNPQIFYEKMDGIIKIKNPYIPADKGIILTEQETSIWFQLCQEVCQVRDVIEEITYFAKNLQQKIALFQLVPSKEMLQQGQKFLTFESDLGGLKGATEQLYLKLTDACNLNCQMCGQAQNKKQREDYRVNSLSFQEVKHYVEPVLDKFHSVVLWGGEPLLHHEIKKFIEYFKSAGKHVSIATNGILLSEYAKVIVDSGVDEVVVSLDGPEEIHNIIRGGNKAFQRTYSGIMALQKEKKHPKRLPNLVVNCTIIKENEEYLEDVLELMKEWNVNQVFYQLPIFVTQKQGSAYEKLCNEKWGIQASSWKGFCADYSLDTHRLYQFYRRLTQEEAGFADFYGEDFKDEAELSAYFEEPENMRNRYRCSILQSSMIIEADGRVVTCPDFPDVSYGNIKTQNYEEIRASMAQHGFKQDFLEHGPYPICSRCCHFV